MKKFLITALAVLSMSISVSAQDAFLNNSLKISVNSSEYVPTDSDGAVLTPITYNFSTYIPLRSLGEALGFSFDYNADTKEITITKGELKTPQGSSKTYSSEKTPIDAQPDTATKIIVDGNVLDTPVLNINSRTYIPVRAVSEALGIDVDYDAQASEVIISFEENSADYSLPQLEKPSKGDIMAKIKTTEGDIDVRLFGSYAPLAVENFVTHSENGYYDGVTFHRVINNFVIQGGDPDGTGMGGESIWGEPFENEVSGNLRHFRGALCMANAGENTNTSQFYIVQNPDVGEDVKEVLNFQLEEIKSSTDFNDSEKAMYTDIVNEYVNGGGYPSLDGGYTVFGQVYSGIEIVDEIAKVQTDENDKPVEDVVITGIDIYTFE